MYNLQGAHFGIPLDDLQAIATRLFKEFPCVKKKGSCILLLMVLLF